MLKNWFKIFRLKKNLYALAEFNHFERVVSYLLLLKKQAILFDSGMGYEDISMEIKKITHNPVSVLLTHAHWDHIGGINHFKNLYVYNASFEIMHLNQGFSSLEIPELQDQKYFYNKFLPKKFTIQPVLSMKTLNDKQILKIDSTNIQVIHTPGHTLGSVCYWLEKENILFTGDTLYRGPLYLHLNESNLDQYYLSLKKLGKLVNGQTLILPGHNNISLKPISIKKVTKGVESILKSTVKPISTKNNISDFKFKTFSIRTKA
jgi:glyoxylase-like metal-dependent hydrolase (beta-lactamase superfamily II)